MYQLVLMNGMNYDQNHVVIILVDDLMVMNQFYHHLFQEQENQNEYLNL